MTLAEPLAPTQEALLSAVRPEARAVPMSGISEVVNYGRTRPGLIPLWVGEGDLPTPPFIQEAATRSLAAGETFYTWQRGIPELRAAIATYMGAHYGRAFQPEQFFVTGGGMQAVQIATRLIAGAGDEVLVPTPAWPNFAAALTVNGARAKGVPMRFGNAGWMLDTDLLERSVGPATTAIVINSPANPTGWTATKDELATILDIARKHGLWILADEIYGRFTFDGVRAASFHDVMEPDDKILFAQTFSKNWCMTGWRIGWLEAPMAFGQMLENLIQCSTSGVAVFSQRAAIAALEQGEPFVQQQIARAKTGRDIMCDALERTGRARFARPNGAFYLFFGIEGMTRVAQACLDLVDKANVGLAPGTAFGPEGEGFFRLCFARKADDLAEASRRLTEWLARR